MLKYLIVIAVGYYVYQQYFLVKNPNSIGQQDKQSNLNNTKEEYVDYEEVE